MITVHQSSVASRYYKHKTKLTCIWLGHGAWGRSGTGTLGGEEKWAAAAVASGSNFRRCSLRSQLPPPPPPPPPSEAAAAAAVTRSRSRRCRLRAQPAAAAAAASGLSRSCRSKSEPPPSPVEVQRKSRGEGVRKERDELGLVHDK
jgi:hypothetical protein